MQPGKRRRAVQRSAPDHYPKGRCPANPHEFSRVGPHGKRRPCAGLRLSTVDATMRGPRSQPQDTATSTSPIWPLASASGYTTSRGLQFLHPCPITEQGPPRVTQEGPLGGVCRRPAHIPQAATPTGGESAKVSPSTVWLAVAEASAGPVDEVANPHQTFCAHVYLGVPCPRSGGPRTLAVLAVAVRRAPADTSMELRW